MNYQQSRIKLKFELFFMYPLIMLGKLVGIIFRLKSQHGIFFILPNRDIGGSPQVNLDILASMKENNPIIIFTKKGNNNQFSEQYEKLGCRIIDASKWIDKKWLHFINIFFRGILASWINTSNNTVVFGGECIYLYKIAPHIKKQIKVVELCHLPTWINYTKAFAPYLYKRVFSTEFLRQQMIQVYKNDKVPDPLLQRLKFIENAIPIPDLIINEREILEVYFIGRGAPQKRVHLVAEIASLAYEKKLPIHFNFVGDVEKVINTTSLPFCHFYGNVRNQDKMQNLYREADILILTSEHEGLPIAIMQMMALGKIVISTAVDAIPYYIVHNENGFLIKAVEENSIIIEAFNLLKFVSQNDELRKIIGIQARKIALQKFNMTEFCLEWKKIFGL